MDLVNEYDLDLSFISPRLIAMGVPVDWKWNSFEHNWRNASWEVKRFLDDGPTDTYYHIYNLCPEMPYSVKNFHGRVTGYDVQDHSRPSMDVVFQFIREAAQFYRSHPRNTVVVHCKAGKGRTGTLCCAWLLYTREANNAIEALEMFKERRTDHIKTKRLHKKMIAVDTWSQVQCVHSVDCWLRATGMYLGEQGTPVAPPKIRALVTQVSMAGMLDVEQLRTLASHNPEDTHIQFECVIRSPAWDVRARMCVCVRAGVLLVCESVC